MSEIVLPPSGPSALMPEKSPWFGKVLAAAGGLALGGTLLADKASGRRWSDTEATTEFCGSPPADGEAWITFAGLGVSAEKTQLMAEAIREAVDTPTGYVLLPQRKPSFEKIGEKLKQTVDEYVLPEVSLFIHSMSALTAARAAHYLPKGVTIKELLFDCSPSTNGFKDVRGSLKPLLARGAAMTNYQDGGALLSGLVAFFNYEVESGKGFDAAGRWKQAYEQATAKGPSPGTWMWQVRTILEAGKYRNKVQEGFTSRLSPDTRIGYCMPENPMADTTVKVEQALARWEYDLGRPIDRLPIKNGGHGISLGTAQAYIETIREWRNNPDS